MACDLSCGSIASNAETWQRDVLFQSYSLFRTRGTYGIMAPGRRSRRPCVANLEPGFGPRTCLWRDLLPERSADHRL